MQNSSSHLGPRFTHAEASWDPESAVAFLPTGAKGSGCAIIMKNSPGRQILHN